MTARSVVRLGNAALRERSSMKTVWILVDQNRPRGFSERMFHYEIAR